MKKHIATQNKVWIISEEKPRTDVVLYILKRLESERRIHFPYELPENCSGETCDNVRILPKIKNNGEFEFRYTVEINIGSNWVPLPVYIMLGQGSANLTGNTGSFVDYLVYVSEKEPTPDAVPIYAIETTKTDFKESRNTSVYQRGTKFAFLDIIYKHSRPLKIMYYHDQNLKGKIPETYKFGMRLYKTIGVEIEPENIRKFIQCLNIERFHSLEELENAKSFSTVISKIRNATDVPVAIKFIKTRCGELVILSAKLEKQGKFAHDPNIGLVSLIGKVVHDLSQGKVPVIVVFHELDESIIQSNKLVLLASRYNIYLTDTKYSFVQKEKIKELITSNNKDPANALIAVLRENLDENIRDRVIEKMKHKLNTTRFDKTNWKLLIGAAREAVVEVLAEDITQACNSCNNGEINWGACLKGVVMEKFEQQKENAKNILSNATYWRYNETSEKNATILLHVLADLTPGFQVIFHNHGGSELGYLIGSDGRRVPVDKKKGIPDLIVANHDRRILWLIEGKSSANSGKNNLINGIKQLFSDKTQEKFIEPKLKTAGTYCDYEIRFGMALFDPTHSVSETLKWVAEKLRGDKDIEDKVKMLDFIFVLSKKGNSGVGQMGVLIPNRNQEPPEFVLKYVPEKNREHVSF